jgi:hypothetical protein
MKSWSQRYSYGRRKRKRKGGSEHLEIQFFVRREFEMIQKLLFFFLE